MMTTRDIVAMLRDVEPDNGTTPAERDGCTLRRVFCPAERYVVDFAEDFTSEGWLQFDTDQDAAYFGVWLNPRQRVTLTYCEGDWTLVECPDVERYVAEVKRAIAFYDEGSIGTTIDADGTVTTWRQDRAAFLVVEDAP